VRNSSVAVTVVVLTRAALELDWEVVVFDEAVVVEDGFAVAWAVVEEVALLVGVAKPLDGLESGGACWRSLPCSLIRAGPSVMSCLRS